MILFLNVVLEKRRYSKEKEGDHKTPKGISE